MLVLQNTLNTPILLSNIRNYTFFFITLFSVISCNSSYDSFNYPASPTKLGKAYHNLTSRYNGYFNARNINKAAKKQLNDSHQDNFSNTIELLPYLSNFDTSSITSQLQKGEEKLAVVIKLHRDKSKWIDDSYYQLANAYYLKKQYAEALNAYDFISEEYNPDKPRKSYKKKKSKNKKQQSSKKKKSKKTATKSTNKKYFLKHKPAIIMAEIDKIKLLSDMGNHEVAKTLIAKLEEKELYKKADKALLLSKAHAALKNGDDFAAIRDLEKLLKVSKNKKLKSRIYYILGQLHQDINNYAKSNEYFKKGETKSVDYNLVINSKINTINNAYLKTNNFNLVEKEYVRLIKDRKNQEYLDQLYFNLGTTAYKADDPIKAKKYLQEALANNNKNSVILSEIYYTLSNISYDDKEYGLSKKYCDSTLAIIQPKDLRIPAIKSKSDNLAEIEYFEDIVSKNDSLIVLSSFDEQQKRAYVKNQVKKTTTNDGFNSVAISESATSTFWIFNDRTIKKAEKDFKKVWGEIPLADNWRISSTNFGNGLTDDNIDVIQSESVVSDSELEEYFKDVPKNGSQMKIVEDATNEALLELSDLYYNKVSDLTSSIEALEDLLKRNRGVQNVDKIYYELYLKSKELGDNLRVEKYKSLLLTQKNDSPYVLLINNPQDLESLQLAKQEINTVYLKATSNFQNGSIDLAEQLISQLIVQKSFGDMEPKIRFLEALIIGKKYGKDQYTDALKTITSRYPNTEESKKASEYLIYLDDSIKEEVSNQSNEPIKDNNKVTTYSFNDAERHFVMIIPKGDPKDIFKYRQSLVDYNEANFTSKKVYASSATVGEGINAIMIRQFENALDAMQYISFANDDKNKKLILGQNIPFVIQVISRTDFASLLKQKDYNTYVEEHKSVYKF